MARRKSSTGIPAAALMAGGFNSGTRAPVKECSAGEVHTRRCHDCGNVASHTDSITPEVLCKKCGSQDTRRVRADLSPAPAPFTCPECGSHEAYLLRDTLLRVTRYEPEIKVVEVESVGELTLDVECKNCRCVVELGEDWTVVEKGQVAP